MTVRLAVIVLAFLTLTYADTLILKSGATIQGNYAGGDTRHVKIVVGDHVETYALEEVSRLEFGGGAPKNYNAATPSIAEPAIKTERRYAETQPPPVSLEIPSGTVLVVRMIDSVDSDRDSTGKTFRASIDEPVVVNGQTVIPRGADVTAKLVDERQSGKFEGRAVLTLDLMQIMINGRMVDVTTSEVSQSSGSRGSRTAKTVGGGAVLGAVLGGIIGGGRGAAIGATSGAAVGGGAQVLTHGQRVKIPSETRLSFTLQNPIRA
jgi:hypothetical protein